MTTRFPRPLQFRMEIDRFSGFWTKGLRVRDRDAPGSNPGPPTSFLIQESVSTIPATAILASRVTAVSRSRRNLASRPHIQRCPMSRDLDSRRGRPSTRTAPFVPRRVDGGAQHARRLEAHLRLSSGEKKIAEAHGLDPINLSIGYTRDKAGSWRVNAS